MSEIRPGDGSQHTLDKQPVHENHTASAQAAPTSVEPVAPQDAQAAGAAKDEQHKLLHANVSGSEQKGAAEKANDLAEAMPGGTQAGYHSTGSYAGAADTQAEAEKK